MLIKINRVSEFVSILMSKN